MRRPKTGCSPKFACMDYKNRAVDTGMSYTWMHCLHLVSEQLEKAGAGLSYVLGKQDHFFK